MTPLEITLLILGIALLVALVIWLVSRDEGSGSYEFVDTSIDIISTIDLSDSWSGDGGGFSGAGSSGSWDD